MDHNVMTILEDHFDKKVFQCSISANNVKKWFEQGYLNGTLGDCENDIEYLNLFYNTFFKGDNK
jgi:hypothetical protein